MPFVQRPRLGILPRVLTRNGVPQPWPLLGGVNSSVSISSLPVGDRPENYLDTGRFHIG